MNSARLHLKSANPGRWLLAALLGLAVANPAPACTLKRWSHVENASGALAAVKDPAHFEDDCGLRASLAGDQNAWLEDHSPGRVFPAADSYSARFNLFVDNAALASGDALKIFALRDADGVELASLTLTPHNGQLIPRLAARDQSGGQRDTGLGGPPLGSGWQSLRLTWRAAKPAQGVSGEWLISVNGQQAGCGGLLTGLDNEGQHIGKARIGLLSGNSATVTGDLDFDSFVSQRNGEPLASDCAIPRLTLPSNQWRQIALPADPGDSNSLRQLFGDDLPEAGYNTSWTVFGYDPVNNVYFNPGLDGKLETGFAWWIIQTTGADRVIDLDAGAPRPGLRHALATAHPITWNMAGPASLATISWDQFTLQGGACDPGCAPAEARAADLFHDQAWNWNGAGYTVLENSAAVAPWTGFWCATLSGAQGGGLTLIFP